MTARDPVISMEMMQNVKMNGVVLRLTSASCPEQYDAYIGGEKVGYFNALARFLCRNIFVGAKSL
jgi:hypothetical protein